MANASEPYRPIMSPAKSKINNKQESNLTRYYLLSIPVLDSLTQERARILGPPGPTYKSLKSAPPGGGGGVRPISVTGSGGGLL